LGLHDLRPAFLSDRRRDRRQIEREGFRALFGRIRKDSDVIEL